MPTLLLLLFVLFTLFALLVLFLLFVLFVLLALLVFFRLLAVPGADFNFCVFGECSGELSMPLVDSSDTESFLEGAALGRVANFGPFLKSNELRRLFGGSSGT